MSINKTRVAIVGVVATMLLAGTFALIYAWQRGQRQVGVLRSAAEKYLAEGNFDAARIEADKLLLLAPNDGEGHLLKAKALLAGNDPGQIRTGDPNTLAAVRSLLASAKTAPSLLETHRLLVTYFLGAGDWKEAATAARPLLDRDPSDILGRYAMTGSLIQDGQAEEAKSHLDILLSEEDPVRPRTAWLAAQIGEAQGRASESALRAEELLQEYVANLEPWDRIEDQLALVRLMGWKARQSKTHEEATIQLNTAFDYLTRIAEGKGVGDYRPRMLLEAALDLVPDANHRPAGLTEVYGAFEPKVDALIDRIFSDALAAQVLDPTVYINAADRLRRNGQVDKAIGVVRKGLETAGKSSNEARQAFGICDLWLAEHYLAEQKADEAQPHIESLLNLPHLRSWGQMLAGQRFLQLGDLDQAAGSLQESLVEMTENGTAHALYGLCQLRRGFVSEGREYLEKGIKLGATAPRYRAWLAMALAEAGYQDQSVAMAQQVLDQSRDSGFGKALLGQLRLRAGQFDQAEKDLQEALANTSESMRAPLQFSLAEIQLARRNYPAAKPLLDELKETSLGAQAYAREYAYLQVTGEEDQARATLEAGRARFPGSSLLLAISVRLLLDENRTEDAIALLSESAGEDPQSKLIRRVLLSEVHALAGRGEEAIAALESAVADFPDEIALRIRLADRYLSEDEFEKAGRVLAELQEQSSINPAVIDYLLARSASLQGNLSEAEKIIEEAAKKDPDNPALKFLVGQLSIRRGDYETASRLFEQTLSSTNTMRRQTLTALVESLLRTGETDRVAGILDQNEQRGEDVRPYRRRLIRLLSRRQEWDTVDRQIAALIKNKPEEADIALAASTYRERGNADVALRFLESWRKTFPESDRLGEYRALLLVEAGDVDGALGELKPLFERYPKRATLHMLRIQAFAEAGQSDKAIEAAREACEACPSNPSVVAYLLRLLVENGQEIEAMRVATDAASRNPNMHNPKFQLARAYEAIGQADRSLDLMTEVIREEPNLDIAAYQYLKMLLAAGRMKELEPTLTRLLTADPDNVLLLGVLGEWHASRGDLEKTRSTLARLEELKPDNPVVPYLKAILEFHSGDPVSAEKYLQVAMANPAGHDPSVFLMARIRASQRRFPEAFKFVQLVRRNRPNLAAAHLLEAQILVEMARLPEAEKICRDFLAQQADALPFRMLLARILVEKGDKREMVEAASLAEGIIRSSGADPGDLQLCLVILFGAGARERALVIIREVARPEVDRNVLLAAGRACQSAGEFEEASRLAKSMIAKDSRDIDARLLLADAMGQIGRRDQSQAAFEEAANQYRKVLEVQPGDLSAANNLAWTLGTELGNPRQALEELAQAIPESAQPGGNLPPEVLDTVGMLHLKLGHLSEAQAYLEEAIAKKPDLAYLHYHLAEVYRLQQRSSLAQQSIQRAQQLDPKGEWAREFVEEQRGN